LEYFAAVDDAGPVAEDAVKTVSASAEPDGTLTDTVEETSVSKPFDELARNEPISSSPVPAVDVITTETSAAYEADSYEALAKPVEDDANKVLHLCLYICFSSSTFWWSFFPQANLV